MSRSPATLVATAGILAASLTGCGDSKISQSTSCKDYLGHPADQRHDAAVRISTEIPGVTDAGNPMWGLSLDAGCGSDPSMTVGQYFRHDRGR